jgi:hypothetical protein
MSKKPTRNSREVAPATCTFKQLIALTRDNLSVGDFWIGTDTTNVWLTEQAMGESPKQTFAIPRRDFNRLIRWYLRPQKQSRKV